MMNPPSKDEFKSAAETVLAWRQPLLVSHAKPDGDAVGSLLAMRDVLRGKGKVPLAVLFDEVPDRYRFLTGSDPLTGWSDVSGKMRDAIDGVLVLDTCAFGQLEPIAEWLRKTGAPIIAIDHHVSRDDLARTYLVDERASATCLILWRWFRAAHWSIDRAIAEALFVGIATDTGWFRHSNTDARTLDAARALVESGARPQPLFDCLYQRESKSRFRLRAAAAGRLELHANDRLAVTTLERDVFQSCGAGLADTEDLVNEPLRIATVVLSVMLVEQEDGLVRVGLRSRAPAGDAFPDVDVAAIARSHGGGGHRRAAGVRMTGSLVEVRTKLISELSKHLSG